MDLGRLKKGTPSAQLDENQSVNPDVLSIKGGNPWSSEITKSSHKDGTLPIDERLSSIARYGYQKLPVPASTSEA